MRPNAERDFDAFFVSFEISRFRGGQQPKLRERDEDDVGGE